MEISAAGLSKVVPSRRNRRGGNKPTASAPEINTRKSQEEGVVSKFLPIRTDLSKEDLRSLLAKVVELGVRLVLRNHVYRWKDEIWLQQLGVPTGLRLSGIIGRVAMDHWKIKMEALMAENKMVSYLLEKYVDDAEVVKKKKKNIYSPDRHTVKNWNQTRVQCVVVENVQPGTRWDGSRLTTTPELAREDLEGSRDLDSITMEAWRGMAASLVPGLDFTVDYCSRNASNTVPMLDFQMWKETIVDPETPGHSKETLRYKFFEKKMSNPKVMDAGWRSHTGLKSPPSPKRVCDDSATPAGGWMTRSNAASSQPI